MRTMMVFCLTVMATVFLGVVVAESALAVFPAWQACTNVGATEGSFEDAQCTKENIAGEYEWEEITSARAVTEEGELEFEDSKTSLGAVRLKCKVVSTGEVGPGSEGNVEKVTTSGCKVVKGTCGSPTVEAVHLPWKTELTEIGGQMRDVLKSGGTGLPGYKSTCTVIIKVTDTCEGETNAALDYNLTEGLTEVEFDSKSPKATCTQSKAETGSIEGTLKATTKGIMAARGKLVLLATPWKMKVNAAAISFDVEYQGKGDAEELSVFKNGNGFEEEKVANECEKKLSLEAGKTCVVKLKCTKAPETGKIRVRSNSRAVISGNGKLKCE